MDAVTDPMVTVTKAFCEGWLMSIRYQEKIAAEIFARHLGYELVDGEYVKNGDH